MFLYTTISSRSQRFVMIYSKGNIGNDATKFQNKIINNQTINVGTGVISDKMLLWKYEVNQQSAEMGETNQKFRGDKGEGLSGSRMQHICEKLCSRQDGVNRCEFLLFIFNFINRKRGNK